VRGEYLKGLKGGKMKKILDKELIEELDLEKDIKKTKKRR